MTIKDLTPTQFENLAYDLVVSLGLANAIWRTPGRDGGRDIEGQFTSVDLSGHLQSQKWYVECKKYESAVDWPTIHEKIAYADSNSADFLLIVTTSSLSPQAVDEVNRWNKKHHLRIRFWNGHEVERLLAIHPAIILKYGLSEPKLQSAAVALEALSLLTLKFSQAAYSKSVFRGQETKELEAAAALADLVMSRTKSATRRLKSPGEVVRPEDLYDWLAVNHTHLSRFDRFGFRAFFAVLRTMIPSDTLALSAKQNVISLKLQRPLTEGQQTDLRELAMQSDFELTVRPNQLLLKGRKGDEN